ncbi:MAG: phosphoribosylanthranilate isomerase [Brevinematia bacterium]
MKIKFCGFTRVEDVRFAMELGIDFQGFVFFKGSRRFITIESFDNIFKEVAGGNFVGVFVNEKEEIVLEVVKKYRIFAQLHGDETNEYVSRLLKEGVPVIKAFRIKSKDDVLRVKESVSEYILIDTFVEGMYGGTGRSLDFGIVDEILSKVENKKIFLSGGINIANIESIIRNFGKYLYAIDLSSGIEKEPGIKSHNLMKEVYDKFKILTSLR